MVQVFLNKNWRVIATMRRADERQYLFEEELAQYGNQLIIATLDVTSEFNRKQVSELLDRLPEPRLDALVNNAGYGLFGALESCTEQQLREQYEVNLIGPALLIRECLPSLRRSKGAVINVSSVMSFVGLPLSSAYSSSKAALTMLSESLQLDLMQSGVRVHAVEPGGFRTGFLNNVQWGSLNIAAYEQQTKLFKAFQEKFIDGPGKDPRLVAERILALASRKHHVVRKQVGGDALLSKVINRSVPEAVRLKLTDWMFRFYPGKGGA